MSITLSQAELIAILAIPVLAGVSVLLLAPWFFRADEQPADELELEAALATDDRAAFRKEPVADGVPAAR